MNTLTAAESLNTAVAGVLTRMTGAIFMTMLIDCNIGITTCTISIWWSLWLCHHFCATCNEFVYCI